MKSPIEYRDVPENGLAKKTDITDGWSKRINGRVYLRHSTEGYECAGSMARWTDEYWAVNFMIDGSVHGQRYRTLSEAERHFDRLMAPPKEPSPADLALAALVVN